MPPDGMEIDTTSELPRQIPACAVRLLARLAWFTDPDIVSRVRLKKAGWFARLLSSPRFVATDIAAIVLGHTIYFRQPNFFDPHTPRGLAFLAHEIKHIEQVEKTGLVAFYWRYWCDYRKYGYGEKIPIETEAYQLQRTVHAHLRHEFAQNNGHMPCIEMAAPHTPNLDFSIF